MCLESLLAVSPAVAEVPAAMWTLAVQVLVPVRVVIDETVVVPVAVRVASALAFLRRVAVAVVKVPVSESTAWVAKICPVTEVAVETVVDVAVVPLVNPAAISVKTTLPVRSLLTESHSPSSSASPISCLAS